MWNSRNHYLNDFQLNAAYDMPHMIYDFVIDHCKKLYQSNEFQPGKEVIALGHHQYAIFYHLESIIWV